MEAIGGGITLAGPTRAMGSVKAEGCGTARLYRIKADKQRGHVGRGIRPKPKAAVQLGSYRPKAEKQRRHEGRFGLSRGCRAAGAVAAKR